MRRIRQRLAEQAFGRSGIAQPREHEVDRGSGGIGGSIEVAPATLDTNVGLIDTPGLIGWFEMTTQPLLQFRTIALDPAPDCRVVRFQAALAEQIFDITERARVPQLPAHGAKNQFGLGLSPLEDRRSDCLLHDLFRLSAAVGQSCNRIIERSITNAQLHDNINSVIMHPNVRKKPLHVRKACPRSAGTLSRKHASRTNSRRRTRTCPGPPIISLPDVQPSSRPHSWKTYRFPSHHGQHRYAF